MKRYLFLSLIFFFYSFNAGGEESILNSGSKVAAIDYKISLKNTGELVNENSPIPLKILPKDKNGIIDWDVAVKKGYIKPLGILYPEIEPPVDKNAFTNDVLIKTAQGTKAGVMFSHKTHTYWFDCNGCHPALFSQKKGGNTEIMNMDNMKKGMSCGKCHNKVAFSLNNCKRCHVRDKK